MASFRDILDYFRPYQAIAYVSIGASSFFEVVDLLVPYAIGQILNVLSEQPVDRLVAGLTVWLSQATGQPVNATLTLAVLMGMIFLSSVARAPIEPWLGVWYHWAIPLAARRDRSNQVMEKILTLPLDFYDEHNPGRIAGRVARGLSNHTWTYPEIAGQLIPKVARVLGIFVALCLIEWQIALAFLASFILILVFTLAKLRRIIRRERVLDRYIENTESRTSEVITNIKTVKAFAAEANELQRQRQRFDREFQVVLQRIHRSYVNLYTWQKVVTQTCVFAVLFAMLAATVQGRISLGHFVTALTVSSMAYAEIDPISQLAEMFARRYASMLRFHEFMQQPAGRDAASLTLKDAAPYRFTGKIELEQLSFGYQTERPVLQDINLLIHPCQTVALVGRSGSGKSTLVKLLFRYFEPHQGRILIDGEDIRSLDVTRYRQRLAIVHQEVDVFNGTLLDNLLYGNPTASFSQVEAACQIARVDEFIDDLPHGYYTVVGERGVRLSGGQKQRIGIARALIVDPDVLVFDEATSSLDYESERSIQLAMRSLLGTRTLLIIAHRLSTVREADQIVVLDNGRILEVGNHDELLQHGGLYHRLHALQASGELR
ncbi:MAG: ABC transporter ATP-binding protein [Spirulinaceae cyanobacterium RM2_2_10]|nr:ABC transporter ATP-binding protein [Spirulinaceae cyanobacterium SM2_1_0]NJO19295.1 ABC transporter ATP-binding protein [Spirulinaceae cyanobacterium RM2_2_10]